MESNDIQALLFTYFSDKLTQEEEKILAEWLKADYANKKIFSEMAEWWAIAHVPHFMESKESEFNRRFYHLIKQTKPVKTSFLNTRRLIRVAASLLILLTVGLSAYYAGTNSLLTSDSGSQESVYEAEVPFGGQSKLILPDQSIVWINAGSTLKYQEDRKLNQREVLLTGEAYFEVASDSLRPFIVKTEKLDVEVLGTTFNVKAYEDDETIDVVLLTGKIDVLLESSAESIELVPNQLLTFNKETEEANVSVVYGLDYAAWKDGILRFSEQSFTKIANVLERVYNVKIEVESEYLKNEYFTGSFTKQHTLNHILEEIDVENKYTSQKSGNIYTIRDK